MELYMTGIDFNFNKEQISSTLGNLLHRETFHHLSQNRINFHLHLHPDKRHRIHPHGGTGALTLPTQAIGNLFLQLHGSQSSPFPVVFGRRTVKFALSRNPGGLPGIVNQITLRAYQPPHLVAQRERRAQELSKTSVSVDVLQFGWECRDYVFSIECEQRCLEKGSVSFGEERREVRVQVKIDSQIYYIAIPFSHINAIYVNNHLDQPAIVFSLNTPPTYEQDQVGSGGDTATLRKRLSCLPIPNHARLAPYVSIAIRLVCSSVADLEQFIHLSNIAQLHRISRDECRFDRRYVFAIEFFDRLEIGRRQFSFCVNFQIESIIRSLVVDIQEMVDMMPSIVHIYQTKGESFTAAVLRRFAVDVKQLHEEGQEDYDGPEDVQQCLAQCITAITKEPSAETLKPSEGSLFDAFHVSITATTMYLDGPFPERSNRVIRSFDAEHHASFLRVTFVDEGKSTYRFDREIDGRDFIQRRVGPFLKEGLHIGNEHFSFLGYSQSALKEHTTWFVKPFICSRRGVVTADSIIRSLGTFGDTLMRCPARYAARISQAFTATDSVEIGLDELEIIFVDDISTEDGIYQFTDGCGNISLELAVYIWTELKKGKKRIRKQGVPKSYQVRFRGCKGMLCVNHRLSGLVMCLPPSMIKFETIEHSNIEIARAFDRPGAYYLNRPLIMLLEGLGVPFEVFKKYQDKTVRETRDSAKMLGLLAPILEQYGLGSSFRLSSVMYHLDKLGIDTIANDDFYAKFVEYAVNHILRDLKNHARIPIPGGWTLVGVADIHGFLEPNKIFACVKPVNGRTIYLEGPILISRSPVTHPGDVMVVEAIGRPPPGSPFAAEPLPNTVVFSTKGERPVPSCLGGGDLDGDVYNLIPLNDLPEFEPKIHNYQPADYSPAPRKTISHPSTMADVADFFMEYINSDVLGLVAINWLLTADISNSGIFDPDCFKLAQLYSDAVDYPKSGQPVLQSSIPKLKDKIKPDWRAPETVNDANRMDYYESTRAIGRLYRAIDLPIEDLQTQNRPRRRQARRGPRRDQALNRLTNDLRRLDMSAVRADDLVFSTVEDLVQDHIQTDIDYPESEVDFIADLFSRYRTELRGHCAANSLSSARHAQLSEEEAIVGTIVQKTSVPRRRKDAMTKLRESTDLLVRAVREQLEGDETFSDYQYLERAWLAWVMSISRRSTADPFGAASFGWIALGAIFDAIGQIEEALKY